MRFSDLLDQMLWTSGAPDQKGTARSKYAGPKRTRFPRLGKLKWPVSQTTLKQIPVRLASALLLIIALASPNVSLAAERGPAEFRGRITFDSGFTASYKWLWSNLAGDKIAWARSPLELKGKTLELSYIPLASIARIDFRRPTDAERTTIAAGDFLAPVLKAKITFHDGTVRNTAFLYAYQWTWKGDTDEGSIGSNVKSLTIDEVK